MGNEKREAQKKNREKAIRKAKAAKSIKWIIIVAALMVILGIIAWAVASSAVVNTKSVSNYSEGLNDDGTITGVRALDYVDLCDYKNITVPKSELEITDEEMQDQINMLLIKYPTYKTDPSITIKDGDTINLDYVGSVDGVEFQGGSTGGAGTLLTIGSGAYIPGFEDAIIGHNVGENFDINVTFPENYGKDELNGKDAVFNITINSVQVESEFTDEFVADNFSTVALTADGYISYYKNAMYEQNLLSYIANYLTENSTVKSYPKQYLKTVKGQLKYDDEKTYESYKTSYGESYTFESYTGMSKKEYEAMLSNEAMKSIDNDLKYQAVYEDAGLSVSSDDITTLLNAYGMDSSYFSSFETTYGRGYVYQAAMTYTVLNYLKGMVTVTE